MACTASRLRVGQQMRRWVGWATEVLQRRSKALFGRTLRVLTPPHQQMMGDLVAEVALVRAPDGVQLELVHRLGRLATQPEDDWMLDESKLPPAPVKPTGDCAQQAS